MSDIQSTFIELVAQVLPEPLEITATSRFVEDLGFDSLKSIMLATLTDRTFELNLQSRMGELLKLATVEAACEYITLQQGQS